MNYKDIKVWQDSMKLAKNIYIITKSFPKDEIYGITSQIRRAAVSIPSNIAEGSAKQSDKEMIQFLYISLGSLPELETQLILSKEIGYFDEDKSNEIENIRKQILGLIKYLKNKNNEKQ